MDSRRYAGLVLILGTLTALAPFSIDMYLPGFSAIAKDLQTTDAKVSLSLTGFFIGISAGQLLYGPLLDKFGRKKPLYIGLIVYILSSIGCSLANSIELLIALRFIQALGSCAATVASVAMVRDLFPAKDSTKVFALLILILGASPMIAPTIGGYITAAVGWHYIFGLLALMGLGVLIASRFGLPNSFVPDKTISLKPRPILRNFREVLTEPQFYTYAFAGAVAFSGLLAYVAGSPLLFMNVFGVSEKAYGWIFAALSIGFVGASQLNSLLLRKFSSEQIVSGALAAYAITGIAFVACALLNLLTLPLVLVFLFLMLSCIGIFNPNASSLCLAPFTKNTGSASALMGALQMGFGAIVSVIISLFDKPSVMPVVCAMSGAALLSLLILQIGKRRIVTRYDGSSDTVLVH
jgi:DHA1 family bicyclomycin/chloramphenicol resistance-like MFS transporter